MPIARGVGLAAALFLICFVVSAAASSGPIGPVLQQTV